MAGRIVALVGPTAVGKSELAIQLARRFDGEIITADSRQVYRYMDIGTAKPSREEQALAPHRMIDVVEPSDIYTVARYRNEARRLLVRLASQGRPAFAAGGTGFYVRALLTEQALPEVEPDPDLRERLRAEAATAGAEALWSRLERVDPVSAARIHPRNLPRTIRALEIVEKLGGPVPTDAPGRPHDALSIGLTMQRPRLHDRADRRVLAQVEAGLVDETRLLLEMGYEPASPALSGFGYREMVSYIRGHLTREDAITAYQAATRRYIRRQMTWFRSQPGIEWYDADLDPAGRIIERVGRWLGSQAGS